MKSPGSTGRVRRKLEDLSAGEESGIPGVAVKCVDIRRNTCGADGSLTATDTEARKRGEQTGLDTLVVHALNDAYLVWVIQLIRAGANALSMPPGEYGREAETQRN